MIVPGKIPTVVVSFNLKNPEEGPFASLRTPFYDQVVSNPIPRIAVVQQVEWRKPPYNSFHSPTCVLTYLNIKWLLEDSMEAYEEATHYADRKQQRKKEIEETIRELQKEILKLIKEMDRL